MTKDLVGTVWDSKDGKRTIVIAGYDGSMYYSYTDLDGKRRRYIQSSGLFRKYVLVPLGNNH